MKRSDFADWIKSLVEAYQGTADELSERDESTRQRVVDVLQIWREALSRDFDFVDAYDEPVLVGRETISKHETAVGQLAEAIRQCDLKNIELWSGMLLGTLKAYLTTVEKIAADRAATIRGSDGRDELKVLPAQNQQRSINLLLVRLEQAELSNFLRSAARRASTALYAAEKAAEDARTAAGVASRSKLTQRFTALASRHFWTATFFRFLTAIGVLGGIWFSLNVSLAQVATGTDTGTGEAIFRVSLLAGVLGLATYFGRQAAYHRDVSTWASTIKEQLLTFDGYIDPIDDAHLRDQLRAGFAARVFGPSPEAKDDAGVTLSSPALSEIAAIFAKSGATTTR